VARRPARLLALQAELGKAGRRPPFGGWPRRFGDDEQATWFEESCPALRSHRWAAKGPRDDGVKPEAEVRTMGSDLGTSSDRLDTSGESEFADRSHEPPRLPVTAVEKDKGRGRQFSSEHEAGNAGATSKIENEPGPRQFRTGVEVGEGVAEVSTDINRTEAAGRLGTLEKWGEFLDELSREPRAIRRRRRCRLRLPSRQKARQSLPGE
jgi:hypothetical protein